MQPAIHRKAAVFECARRHRNRKYLMGRKGREHDQGILRRFDIDMTFAGKGVKPELAPTKGLRFAVEIIDPADGPHARRVIVLAAGPGQSVDMPPEAAA